MIPSILVDARVSGCYGRVRAEIYCDDYGYTEAEDVVRLLATWTVCLWLCARPVAARERLSLAVWNGVRDPDTTDAQRAADLADIRARHPERSALFEGRHL